jgi:suppressor of G2 allele of SKP1
MTSLTERAQKAYAASDYDSALMLFNQALKADPDNATLYTGRAATYVKLEQHIEASEDAGKAIALDSKQTEAYLQRGIALFELEEFESAKEALQAGLALQPDNATFKTWIRKCNAELEDEEAAAPQANGHAAAPAKASSSAPANSSPTSTSAPAPSLPGTTSQGQANTSDKSAPIAPAAPQEHTGKYRHQWYQTQQMVEVAVLAKGLPPERVNVDIQEDQLCITTKDEAGKQDYELKADLFGKVDPAASKWELLKTKIEVRLRKADSLHWGDLQRKSGTAPASAGKAPTVIAAATPAAAPAQEPARPAYPSSFKRKPVDWDKLDAELGKEEEKLEGDAALQKLFKDIYSKADEDTRRAMNKSFQESNGTVLSTNWKEVGTKKIENAAKDADVHKWET